jgi:hypothetical protein
MKVFGHVADLSTINKNRVLLVCNAPAHVSMAINLCVCQDVEYLIYFRDVDVRRIATKFQAPRVQFSSDEDLVFARLHTFNLILSFATLCAPHHLVLLPFLSVAKRVGIPIVEIQHGLFQYGINYYDDSRVLDFRDIRCGQGDVPSFADHQMRWFGGNGIGYPRHQSKCDSSNATSREFVLIASNINWYLYEDRSRLLWISLIDRICAANPDLLFVWKPHPAESVVCSTYYQAMQSIAHNNFLEYGIDRDIYFNGVDGLEELACYAKAGILTVGTSILDFALYSKPCVVYDLPEVSELIGMVKWIDRFSDQVSLQSFLDCLKSGNARSVEWGEELALNSARVEELTRAYMRSEPLPASAVGEVLSSFVFFSSMKK